MDAKRNNIHPYSASPTRKVESAADERVANKDNTTKIVAVEMKVAILLMLWIVLQKFVSFCFEVIKYTAQIELAYSCVSAYNIFSLEYFRIHP